MDLNDQFKTVRCLLSETEFTAYFKGMLVCSYCSQEMTLYKMFSYWFIKVGIYF